MNRTEYHKQWRKNNPEKWAKVRQRFYEEHPEKQTEYVARWRERHREEYNAYHREYYRRMKEKKVDS